MGLMGAVMGIGMVGGPLLGGVITDSAGWRWNFFIGLPFAVAAIVVLQRTLHLPARKSRTVRIDYAGATLLSVGIATLLLWITFAGTSFDWASWQTAAMVGGSLVALALAVWVESRAAEPIIPLHLFKNRTLVLAVVASIAVGVAMFGTTVFLSQYMQLARGKTPTQSGLLTIPMIVGLLISSTISGQIISRTGRYKKFMIAGAVLLTAGTGLMGTIHFDTSFTLVALYLVVIGAGVGMLMQNLVLAVQNTLDVREVGSGTSTVAFFRTWRRARRVRARRRAVPPRDGPHGQGPGRDRHRPVRHGLRRRHPGPVDPPGQHPHGRRAVVRQRGRGPVPRGHARRTDLADRRAVPQGGAARQPLRHRAAARAEAAMLAPATAEASVDAELDALTDQERISTRD